MNQTKTPSKGKQIIDSIKNVMNKITNLFDKIASSFIRFFNYNHFWLMVIVITILCFIARYALIPVQSGDSYWFLEPWVKFIRDNGGLASLDKIPISYYKFASNIPYGHPDLEGLSLEGVATVLGNYPVFYYFLLASFSYLPLPPLYVIKIVSFIFDFILALAILVSVKHFTKSKVLAVIGYLLALVLPTFFINSAIWGQTDAVYGGLAIWCIYFLIKDKPKTAMIFIGIALSIKIQTVFILPIVGWLFLKRKFRLIYLFIPIVVVFLSFIPSYLAGMDFMTPINQFKNLSGTYSSVNMNSGSIYAIFDGINAYLSRYVDAFGIPIAFLILLVFIYYIYMAKLDVNDHSILAVGTLFAILTPYLLPHMHERYFFMAEAFLLLYALTHKNRWHLVILSQVSGLFTYSNFILGGWFFPELKKGNLILASIMNLVIIVLLFKDITVMIKAKKETVRSNDDFS